MAILSTESTYRFQLIAQKDGAAWDLTGATVTLYLTSPAGVTTAHSAAITNAAGGIAEYVSAANDLATDGLWSRRWVVSQSAIIQRSLLMQFTVQ